MLLPLRRTLHIYPRDSALVPPASSTKPYTLIGPSVSLKRVRISGKSGEIQAVYSVSSYIILNSITLLVIIEFSLKGGHFPKA